MPGGSDRSRRRKIILFRRSSQGEYPFFAADLSLVFFMLYVIQDRVFFEGAASRKRSHPDP
jgi:hypothetical protein